METFINERWFQRLQVESERRVALWKEVLNSDETYKQKVDKLALMLDDYESRYSHLAEKHCELDAWYQHLEWKYKNSCKY